MLTKDEITEKSKEIANKTTIGLFAKLNWFPFFGASAETNTSADFSLNGSSLIKTTLSNTVLTDFLEKSEKDDRIVKFVGYKVSAYKNSIAYLKMFTPYLKITKSDFSTDEGYVFDISKLDEAFESGKGYYELIGEKQSNNILEKCVLRFNIEAFRNNYGIADLVKMNLKYIGVKVGHVSEYMLDIAKEFNFEQTTINSAFDLLDIDKKQNELDVYDVILAGVEK